jgi:hypothetical protein
MSEASIATSLPSPEFSLLQLGYDPCDAALQQVRVLAQLRREAIAGVLRGHVAVGATAAASAGCSETSATVRVHVGRAYSDFASAMPIMALSG